MNPLVKRFQRKRWGAVRKLIDGLGLFEQHVFSLLDYNTATTTVYRLEIAYGDRSFRRFKDDEQLIIWRVK